MEEIERKSHDSEECKCSFLVRYDYDDLEVFCTFIKHCQLVSFIVLTLDSFLQIS